MDERLKCETGVHQNENIGSNLFGLGCSNFLQDTSLKAREAKVKMNYWDFIKIKTSAQQRKQSTKLKGNARNGRRYLQMTLQIKDWYPRSTKNFSNSISKKQTNQKMDRRYEQTHFQ